MNRQLILDRLQELKLTGMERVYRYVAGLQSYEQPTTDELMARLAEVEHLDRMQKQMQMLTRQNKLRYDARLALLQILEDRYGQKATVVVSQLPVNKWHAYINQHTLADAICDRLEANAIRIDLQGKSIRRKYFDF